MAPGKLPKDAGNIFHLQVYKLQLIHLRVKHGTFQTMGLEILKCY
jgi:hypothetical protein